MAKNITKVPNGPLIKKKGPFKGSTLKTGGTIKKAQTGDTLSVKKPMTYAEKRAAQEIVKQQNREKRENVLNRNAAARGMTREQVQAQQEKDKKKPDACVEGLRGVGKDNEGCSGSQAASARRVRQEARRKNGGPVKKAKAGAMIKRADGSMSRRGLWDNLRSKAAQNKKTGAKPKAPTKAMLTQEKKIKAKAKK
jgi:hypothetical protein